jgi:hypothetical protein
MGTGFKIAESTDSEILVTFMREYCAFDHLPFEEQTRRIAEQKEVAYQQCPSGHASPSRPNQPLVLWLSAQSCALDAAQCLLSIAAMLAAEGNCWMVLLAPTPKSFLASQK